jgi:hypothetical protein
MKLRIIMNLIEGNLMESFVVCNFKGMLFCGFPNPADQGIKITNVLVSF